MESLINKRVKIIKGRDKDKFGMILEIIKTSSDGTSIGFLVELNNGKINNYVIDELEILDKIYFNKEGKVDMGGNKNEG